MASFGPRTITLINQPAAAHEIVNRRETRIYSDPNVANRAIFTIEWHRSFMNRRLLPRSLALSSPSPCPLYFTLSPENDLRFLDESCLSPWIPAVLSAWNALPFPARPSRLHVYTSTRQGCLLWKPSQCPGLEGGRGGGVCSGPWPPDHLCTRPFITACVTLRGFSRSD